jgi:antitoxin component YwqK of YwqJK toxin-antitoxin module
MNIQTGLLMAFTFMLLINLNLPAQSKVQIPKIKSLIVNEQQEAGKGPGKPQLESETNYDPAGNVIEEKQYKDGKLDSHVKNEYDSDSNKIKVTELDDSGKILKYTVYKYDKGLRTEKLVYLPNQKLKSRKTYQYKFY